MIQVHIAIKNENGKMAIAVFPHGDTNDKKEQQMCSMLVRLVGEYLQLRLQNATKGTFAAFDDDGEAFQKMKKEIGL